MLGRWIAPLSIGAVGWWFALAAMASPTWGQGGGLGTAENPYLVFTAGQLDAIGATPEYLGKHFKLMADIDLKEYGLGEFHVIGASEDAPFRGVFDGNGKTISNLQLAREFGGYLGLFGLVSGEGARIENLTLVNPGVVSEIGRYAGALAGGLEQGAIVNCHVRGGSVQAFSHVGGLVGRNSGGTIAQCTASTLVQGASRVGGLAGQCFFGVVERCHAKAEVLAPLSSYWVGGLIGEVREATVSQCRADGSASGDACVGGLVGESYMSVIERCCTVGSVSGVTNAGGILGLNSGGGVDDCHATAQVRATTGAGGLVGCNGPSCHCAVYVAGVVRRCYAAGPVSGTIAGGLVGVDDRGEVFDSFWDVSTSGCATSAGGDGSTSSKMAMASMYLAAGWDFVGEKANGTQEIWYMPAAGGYPRLAWELADGDFNADARVDFHDFGQLAARWGCADTGDWSGGRYAVPDCVVDFDDLARLAGVWLAGH